MIMYYESKSYDMFCIKLIYSPSGIPILKFPRVGEGGEREGRKLKNCISMQNSQKR